MPAPCDEILARIDTLKVWKAKGKRAPHKPLLLLLALGRWSRGLPSEARFEEIGPELRTLLEEFGPDSKSYHPEYPFWHLRSDELWTVTCDREPRLKKQGHSPSKSELLAVNARGRLSDELLRCLEDRPEYLRNLVDRILERNFPRSIHDDLLQAAGVTFQNGSGSPASRKRDPRFRDRVLTTYQYRCAVCGFDGRMATMIVGLEAAHIKWHQAGGPDVETNGLALCSLHHKMFDMGVFTICHEKPIVLLSDRAHGSQEFHDLVLRYHGQGVRSPQRPEHYPAPPYLRWHREQVFKGEPRHLPPNEGEPSN